MEMRGRRKVRQGSRSWLTVCPLGLRSFSRSLWQVWRGTSLLSTFFTLSSRVDSWSVLCLSLQLSLSRPGCISLSSRKRTWNYKDNENNGRKIRQWRQNIVWDLLNLSFRQIQNLAPRSKRNEVGYASMWIFLFKWKSLAIFFSFSEVIYKKINIHTINHKTNWGLIICPPLSFNKVSCAVLYIPVYFFMHMQTRVNAIRTQITKIPIASENFPRF